MAVEQSLCWSRPTLAAFIPSSLRAVRRPPLGDSGSTSDYLLLVCQAESEQEAALGLRALQRKRAAAMKFGHDLLTLEAGAPDNLRGQFIQYKQVRPPWICL